MPALKRHSFAGDAVVPFVSQGLEGFDINDPEDWWLAERLLANGEARLPALPNVPYPLTDN
jgi:N-acylneuraminate cytidylyltransferase